MWGMLRAVEGHAPGHLGQAEATLAAAVGGGLAFAGAAAVTGIEEFDGIRALIPWLSRRSGSQ